MHGPEGRRRGSGPLFEPLLSGARLDRSRAAIAAPIVGKLGACTGFLAVNLPRIAFAFGVFLLGMILSGASENRKNGGAREQFRTGAVEYRGTVWLAGRSLCAVLPRRAGAKIARICGDRASIGRAGLRRSPGSTGRSGRRFPGADWRHD